MVVAAEGFVSSEDFAVKQRAVGGPHDAAQARGETIGIEGAQGVPQDGEDSRTPEFVDGRHNRSEVLVRAEVEFEAVDSAGDRRSAGQRQFQQSLAEIATYI